MIFFLGVALGVALVAAGIFSAWLDGWRFGPRRYIVTLGSIASIDPLDFEHVIVPGDIHVAEDAR